MSDSFRTQSPYFKALAWKTDILLTPDGLDSLANIHPFEKCVAALLATERNIHNFSQGHCLVREFCRTGQTPPCGTLASKGYGLWFKEMMRYRLVDIVAFVHKKGTQLAHVPCGYVPEEVVHRLSSKLFYWPNIVSQAKKIIKSQNKTLPLPHLPPALPQSSISAAFQALCIGWKMLNKNKILLNFSTVLFVLCYVLEGHPFLPTEKEDILKLLDVIGPDDLIPEGLQSALLTPERFQTSFFSCFAISPICMLVTATHFDKSIGKDLLYKYWNGVGNERSPLTERVERLLWGAIFQAVQEPGNLLSILQTTLAEIKEDELLALNDEEASIFRGCAPSKRQMAEDKESIPEIGQVPGSLHNMTAINENAGRDEKTTINKNVDGNALRVDETTTTNDSETAHEFDELESSMDADQSGLSDVDDNVDVTRRRQTHDNPAPSRPISQPQKRGRKTIQSPVEGSPIRSSTSSNVTEKAREVSVNPTYLEEISSILVQQPRPLRPVASLLQKKGKSVSNEAFVLHAPGNDPYNWVPAFHHQEELDLFRDIHWAVEEAYVDNMPKWKTSPEESSICILTKHEMDMMTDAELQGILRHRHIYVKNQFEPQHRFDSRGLGTLTFGQLEETIVIQDFTRKEKHQTDSRHALGSLRDLLDSHKAGADGKILNAPHFPMPWRSDFTSKIASDIQAFNFTSGLPACPMHVPYPASAMSWGFAATSGAHSLPWHIDCDGFGTYVDVQAGCQWWVMGRPKPGERIRNFTTFMHGHDSNTAIEAKFDLEAILLVPGSRLIMRPATPHISYTPESSICHGGHFYAISTIRQTIYGIYHAFSAGGVFTSAKRTHHSLLLLRRLLTYIHYILVLGQFTPEMRETLIPHVPNVATIDGALDLFALCILVEIGSLLDLQEYIPGTTHQDSPAGIYARGLARSTMRWWDAHYEFIDNGRVRAGGEVYREIFSHQAKTLVADKRLAEVGNLNGDEGRYTADVFQSLLNVRYGDEMHSASVHGSSSFDGPWEKSQVRRRAVVDPDYALRPIGAAMFMVGVTPADQENLKLFHALADEASVADYYCAATDDEDGDTRPIKRSKHF